MSEPDTDTDEFQSAAEEEEAEGECGASAPGVTGSLLAARLEQMPLPSGEDATFGQETRTGVQSIGARAPCESTSDVREGGSLGGDVGTVSETVTGDGVEVEGENVSGLDNRYVSEDVVVKGKEVELTEEQAKELREQAGKLKAEGNEAFKSGDYSHAEELYTEALSLYPPGESIQHDIAVCFANRAACHAKMGSHERVVEDCTKAVELEPVYLKAWVRRGQANEALEKYEEAMEDYKKVLELDPSQPTAQQAVVYLPEKIKEQQEKLKAEMLGKLKELGNAVLKPFGLSTDNFQFQQDPNTGGYTVNFKR